MEAEHSIAQSLALANEAGSRSWEGTLLYQLGQVYLVEERWAEAGTHLEESVALLEALGSRLELARALSRRARLRQVSGQPEAAQVDADRATQLLESCGAPADLDQVNSGIAG
jgi:uncharacterized protein HemY